MVLSGETGQILKEEMNVGEEFFPNCFKDGKFSIDCQRSDYLRINTSRTVWVSSEKSFIIEVRWDPGTLLNNSKEMFRTRFLVAHELGHILLHSSGQPRIPFYSGRCRPEQEQEADSFARSLVDLDFDWMCDSIHHTLCSLTNADKVEVITEIEAERKDCGLKYKIQ